MSLVEIGPRFVLTPIRIFEGAFGGATVFSNPGDYNLVMIPTQLIIYRLEYISPAAARMARKQESGTRYAKRKDAEAETQRRKEARQLEESELSVAKVFAWAEL